MATSSKTAKGKGKEKEGKSSPSGQEKIQMGSDDEERKTELKEAQTRCDNADASLKKAEEANRSNEVILEARKAQVVAYQLYLTLLQSQRNKLDDQIERRRRGRRGRRAEFRGRGRRTEQEETEEESGQEGKPILPVLPEVPEQPELAALAVDGQNGRGEDRPDFLSGYFGWIHTKFFWTDANLQCPASGPYHKLKSE